MTKRSERIITPVPVAHWCTAHRHSVAPHDEMARQ